MDVAYPIRSVSASNLDLLAYNTFLKSPPQLIRVRFIKYSTKGTLLRFTHKVAAQVPNQRRCIRAKNPSSIHSARFDDGRTESTPQNGHIAVCPRSIHIFISDGRKTARQQKQPHSPLNSMHKQQAIPSSLPRKLHYRRNYKQNGRRHKIYVYFLVAREELAQRIGQKTSKHRFV